MNIKLTERELQFCQKFNDMAHIVMKSHSSEFALKFAKIESVLKLK